ncbi:Highly reducing polyketide synthase FUM1 [Lachnellula arida]|uniref:Highly reducing polyketide synthase FUM1 n=1 Tax=Lachnellula arida TaxID=1316785 RepID=A0A8T9BPH7_9HELO|nr:Highly reducing polyketide synthase FUM1 [Lachnellula arida]
MSANIHTNGHTNGTTNDVELNGNGFHSSSSDGSNTPPETNGTTNGHTNGYTNGFSKLPEAGVEPIAIIGMGMRLPGGVHDSESFWKMLVEKREARCRVPADRYNVDAFYNKTKKPQSVATDSGYFLEDVNLDDFDSGFFNLGKKELDRLDPQQRLLMEVVWETLENSGETNWRGENVGCYIGVFGEDWLETQLRDTQEMGSYRITGHGDYVLANRVSYEFDFKGPSLVIKTGCSSSLIGLHMACDALRNGDCTSAVVAGTNLIMTPTMTIAMTEQGVVSPTGTCKSFDASADGYARGEAVNCVYIKKLSDAIRDGDPIRGVVRSTAINCDGKTPGISYPNTDAHETLMRRAYKVAGIENFSETAMVECHGTGTPIGDPVETNAVARVFGKDGVIIGAVKPNVGHSEGASGLTSTFKMLLAMEKLTIPPNMRFKNGNPKIPFEEAKLTVPLEPMSWPVGRKERVSVNSFGIGGSNAHVVIDSAAAWNVGRPKSLASNALARPELLVFSANHQESLKRVTQNYEKFIEEKSANLSDLAYTLASRRTHMQYRSFTVAGLDEPLTFAPPIRPGNQRVLVFVFTGQGAQWAGMGKELLTDYPPFQDDIRAMDKTLAHCPNPPSWTIEGMCSTYTDELLKPQATSLINRPELSQPLCSAVQIALVNLFRSWDVKPQAVVGHSSGEIAGAYAAEALTADEAILMAYYRGQVMKLQGLAGGMAAIGLGREAVTSFLVPGVVIACENSPESVTLSGDADKLVEVMDTISQANPDKLVRRLKVDMAYHSHHMAAIGEQYQALIQDKVSSRKPTVPFFSSVTGKAIRQAGKLDAAYWRSNLESPHSCEVNPGACSPKQFVHRNRTPLRPCWPLRQIFSTATGSHAYLSTLQRNNNGTKTFLSAIGQLHCHGTKLDFSIMNPSRTVLPDLPLYPWHYERKFWNESRLSKAYRQLQFPHHDVLGSRVAEVNDFEPTWRNILKLDNVPWIADHKISTDIVFPAAGYLSMVGEAIRQLTASEDYTVRNVTLTAAMVLEDSKDTEVMTSLRPSRLTVALDSAWYDFTVTSYNGAAWTKHCVGQVRSGFETDLVDTAKLDKIPREVSTRHWYAAMRKVSLNYGPAFSGLDNISAGVNEHTAVADVVNWEREDESPYSLHPATLDPCFQLVSAALAYGQARKLNQMCLPTSIDFLSIRKSVSDVRMFAETVSSRKGVIIGDAFGATNGEPVMRLRGLRLSPVENDSGNDPDPHAAIQLEWKPDIDFLQNKDLIRTVKSVRETHKLGEKLTALCILETSSRVSSLKSEQPHLNQFIAWIAKQVSRIEAGDYALVDDAKDLAKLDQKARMSLIDETSTALKATDSPAAGTALARIVENIQDIIDGKVDPLELLMKDDILTEIYNFAGQWDYTDFFSSLTHKKPHLKILEIGAGTGGTTDIILKNLSSTFGERMYAKYTFTDISAGFFGAAKERFHDYAAIDYAVLDVSKDPIAQGFEANSYDLIVATNVIHATPVLQESLSNIHKLLQPNGQLFLQELCPDSKWVNYIMGLFQGWWLGEADNRFEQPFVSPQRWDEELKKSGFSGAETVLYDDEKPYQNNANILARPAIVDKSSKSVTLLSAKSTDSTVTGLETVLKGRGFQVDVIEYPQLPPAKQDIIAVVDLAEPFFTDIEAEKLKSFQDYTLHLQNENIGMLWVTQASQILCKDPRYAQAIGIARTARSELGISLATLELDAVNTDNWGRVADVYSKFQRRTKEEEVDSDMEFAVAENIIYTSRFHWISVNKELSQTAETKMPKRLEVEKKGMIETLHWAQFPEPELKSDEVIVETHAIGMNFKDVLISMGIVDAQRSDSSGLGCECAGFIRKVGSAVTRLAPGDRVVVQATGTLETRVKANSKLCVKIPQSLSFEDAATMPVVYGTVVHSVMDLGHLEKDQTILIHSAAGGVGIAAIQIAQYIGAEIYLTVGNEDKVKYLMDTYGIARDHIFHSRDASFLPDILRATNGKGVDMVLNSLSGDLLHASWQCVAQYGKMLEIGKRDFIGQGKLGMSLFEANRSFFGIDLAVMAEERPDVIHKLLNKVLQLYIRGAIKPVRPIKVFEAAQIKDAFRYMQQGQHMGKIVLKMPLNPEELTGTSTTKKLTLRPDVSYLMIGGLGGLGQAISTWMAESGAKNLIFLSRSAGKTEAHKSYFKELETMGCSVQAFAGSVSVLADVENVVKNATMPIGGVMQMSMVLRDQAFARMSIDEWNAAVAPKVDGTWNLHKALEKESLDFLILFSSFSGLVGQWGQVNYNSGNTFLDAFVQYRHNLELPASVLDIGCVVDAGYVSENQSVLDTLLSTSLHGLHEQDVLESLQMMMGRSAPAPASPAKTYTNPGQVGIGLRSTMPLAEPGNRSIWKRDPRMAVYRNLEAASSSSAASDNEPLRLFLADAHAKPAMLTEKASAEFLAREIGLRLFISLMKPEEDLDISLAPTALGLDSLIAIDLRNWWRESFGFPVTVLEMMNAKSIVELGELAAKKLLEKLQPSEDKPSDP